MRRDIAKLHPFYRLFVKASLSTMIVYNLYALTTGRYDIYEHMFINLVFIIPVGFILYSPTRRHVDKVGWYDVALVLISYAVTITFWRNYYDWVFNRMWLVSPLSAEQIVCGIVLIAVMLELIRRCFGRPLLILSIVCLAYGLLCPYLPYPFGFRTQPVKIIDLLLFTPYGILSTPLEVMVTYVVAFTLLGSALQLARADSFFIDLAKSLVGKSVGGIGKVSVITSALFGTISGSAVANVYATGTITIPTMISMRYPRDLAAAIEAVASTGGQITPPIMGAAAFVMAEILGVPYLTIVIAAIIPAALYYFSLYTQLHYTSLKLGLRGLPKEEIPRISSVLKRQGYRMIPLLVFVYFLAVENWGPISSAMAAFYASLGISLLRAELTRRPSTIIDTLTRGVEEAVSVILVACAAGIVVGVLTYTGITLKFGSLVMRASLGIQEVALIYIAALTILMGMGVPTTAAYIMTSAVALPALSLFGVKGIVAHMFIFYYAILSAITPPVALASFAAASLAKAHPMRVGFLAMKLGLALFFIPFTLVSKPELLLVSGSYPISDLVWALSTVIVACFLVPVGLVGYIRNEVALYHRLALILLGIALLYLREFALTAALMLIAILLLAIHHRQVRNR